MFSLRRATIRVFSSSPSTVLSSSSRTFTSLRAQPLSLLTAQKSFGPHLQRRFASEEAATQYEPEADGASEAQHGGNSIATAAAEELAREEAAASAAASSYSEGVADDTTLNGARNDNGGGVISEAAASVAGTAAAVGESLAGAAGFGNPSDDPTAEVSKSVYVGNLFFDVREEDLKQEFAQAGTVVNARVIMDSRGLSKGFGYVDFDSVESATKAIELYNMQNFEGRRISVQYSGPRRRRADRGEDGAGSQRPDRPLNAPTKTLFIGNMAFDMSDRDLNNLFRDIKNVIDVRVAIDRRTGQPRGFSHADFTDIGSAERAMAELRGKVVNGRPLRVDYSVSSTGRGTIGGGSSREGGRERRDRGDDDDAGH